MPCPRSGLRLGQQRGRPEQGVGMHQLKQGLGRGVPVAAAVRLLTVCSGGEDPQGGGGVLFGDLPKAPAQGLEESGLVSGVTGQQLNTGR